MSEIVLEIKGLTRRFGSFTAVDALTLSVKAGEVFGLLGSNGAGILWVELWHGQCEQGLICKLFT